MVREEGPSSLARGVGPNVFRAVLMNASQLASYDFFKAELLKSGYFEDNIYCHTAASFAAVSPSSSRAKKKGIREGTNDTWCNVL